MQLNQIDPDGSSGPDIEHVIETWLKQQARFELPGDAQTVIYPLTFWHHSAGAGAAAADQLGGGGGGRSNGDGTLLGLLVAEAPDIDMVAGPIQDQPPALDPAALNPAFRRSSGVEASRSAPLPLCP